MDLSNDLISKFVKITNDGDKKKTKEGTVYGTAVKYDGNMYVKIDGSDLLTPIDTTADIKEGERVTIMIKDHNATVTGNVTSPSASSVDVKKVTKNVEEIEGEITEFEAIIADVVHVGELDAEVARIDELIAGKATIEDLTATNAEITNLKAKDAEIENLVADKATIEDLTVTNAEITNLKANKADITYLDANFATIDQLKVTHADIDVLDAEVANINTLVNGNLTSDNILSFNITSKNTTMEDAFIKDAMIDRITANKIMSGTIDTNNVVIQSTDGSMLLQGNILQMKDESGKVRIQIGKDTGGNFTFVLYDESGKGVLIDEEGIKSSDAIADGLIVDAKVADNANISGSKLDIASVITEVNNDNSTTIKSNKIYLDEQNQSLEVAFNSLKSQVETIQDVTIDGDLSSIVEQVQSNTTKIEVNKESINTLVAENVIRTEEISDLEGELQQVNTTLSNKYASLEQNLDGFKTTVSDTYTTKAEFNNLEVGGRNLIIRSTETKEYCIGMDGAPMPYAGNAISDYISVLPDTIYTFTKTNTVVTDDYFRIAWYNENKTLISREPFTDNKASRKSPTNAYFIRVSYPMDSLPKLEKGNKATDWSPAPEDVQANIDAVDGKFANYSTTTQMNSAINQKANEITSSVSSTYTTKTEFNNLEVGGRNLFIGSKDYAAGTWLNKSQWGSNGTTSDGLIILSKSTPWAGLYQSFTMKPNEVYTMSAYIKGDGKATVNCYCNGSILKRSFSQGETASTTWRHYWFTCENTSTSDVSWTGRFENGIDNATLQIYGIKCEKGNKATDWTPAPEDVQANIDNLQVGGRNYALSSNTEKNAPNNTMVLYDISTKAQTELQGKEVTISFEAKKTSGTANIFAYLRDPSVGSIAPESDRIGDITTSYKRYSITFTASSDLSKASQIGIHSTTIVGLYVRNVKLEKGNMPTDWTPAPEDVQANIDAVDGKFANYSTTTQMNSAIQQKANEITSSVSSTYTTKTELNNLQVGGRNYLTNSKRKGCSILQGTPVINFDETTCPNGINLTGDNTNKSAIRIKNVITSNGYWTVSFEMRGSQSVTVNLTMDICDLGATVFYTTADNTWKKYSFTVNVTNYTSDVYNFVDIHNIGWAYFFIRNMKVEKGNKATDYTPAPEDVQSQIDTINTNLTTYATKSELTQTSDSITAKFSESGGYNHIYNSYVNVTSSTYGISVGLDTSKLVPGKKYTLTLCGRKTASSNTGYPRAIIYTTDWAKQFSAAIQSTTDTTASVTFTLPTDTTASQWRVSLYHYPSGSTGTSHFKWVQLTDGSLEQPWSPHPSEIYDGVTRIDKDGIKVSQSSYSGHTHMSAGGFYVNNGTEDVVKVTKDGAFFKGKVVITSGSTVPTSTLSGSISSSQLDSSISTDISTAKSNASTAVSTANTASTNASNAVKTANTASTNASNAVSTANTASTNASNAVKTANTASTNASTAVSTANTAKSTADSVKSTVDSGKTNWTNAYNRVNEWAYGAVTGSTTIDGGYIQANTIVSDKIAAGAIIAAKIAAGAITADKIAAGAITAAKIAAGAITADKLAANAITSKTITGSTITGGTISGATITSETLMKTYGGMYVGSEIWGGFKKDSNGNYSSAQTFTIRGSTALQIDGNPTRISSVTGEVKIGDASSYDNLRAREIYAQEIIYTNDLRTRDAAQLSLSNVSMRSANAFIDFSSGYGVIRVTDRNHLYLQTKGNTGGDTSAEIRCTRYADASNYVNIRAYNVCAQNAVYANGVNVSSDINRKRDIELYSTDALQEVCSTPVYAYHLDTDKDEELKRIGIIMQEAPLDAIDLTGKGVDLYQMVTMLWRAVQQQQEIINELKGE